MIFKYEESSFDAMLIAMWRNIFDCGNNKLDHI